MTGTEDEVFAKDWLVKKEAASMIGVTRRRCAAHLIAPVLTDSIWWATPRGVGGKIDSQGHTVKC